MQRWSMPEGIAEIAPQYNISEDNLQPMLDYIANISKEDFQDESVDLNMTIKEAIPVASVRITLMSALINRELELGLIESDAAEKTKKHIEETDKGLQRLHDKAKYLTIVREIDSPFVDNSPFITTHANPNVPRLYYVIPETDEQAPRIKEFANFDIIQWKIIQGKQEHSSEITIRHMPEGMLAMTNPIAETKVIKLNAGALSALPALRRAIVKVFNGAIINEVSRTQTSDLNHFLRYLNSLTPVIEEAKDFYGFDSDKNGVPFFHHGDAKSQQKDSLILTSGKNKLNTKIVYKGASFKALWSIPEINKPEETLELFLDNYSRMYNPGKAFAVLGWMCAGMIHQKLRADATDYQHPILYMWGPADIGKSTLVRNLFKVFGWAGVDGKSEEYIFGGSNATNRDILTAYNVPVIVGEFRNAFVNAEEMVRTLLAVYDGMTSGKKVKGDGDAWEQDSIPYRAALAVLSNNVITDAAARSRFIEIQATKQDIPVGDDKDCYKVINNMPAGSIGAIFIRWVLQNWDQLPAMIAQIDQSIEDYKIEGRSKNILRAVAYGLNIFDKMVSEYGLNFQAIIKHNITDIYAETIKLIDTKKQSSEDADFCKWIADEISSSPSGIQNWTSYIDKHTDNLIFVCEKSVIEKYLRRNGINQKINNAIAEFRQTLEQQSDIYKIAYTRALATTTKSSNTERLIINVTAACRKYNIEDISVFIKDNLDLGNLVLFKSNQ